MTLKRNQTTAPPSIEGTKATPLCGRSFISEIANYILKAKREVRVIQYQWNWYGNDPTSEVQKLNQIVAKQMLDGVKYKILLNNYTRSKHILAVNNRATRELEKFGATVKYGGKGRITHAKLWLIDDEITILGSHNLSDWAVTQNYETSVAIENRRFTNEIAKYFELIWSQK